VFHTVCCVKVRLARLMGRAKELLYTAITSKIFVWTTSINDDDLIRSVTDCIYNLYKVY